MGFSVKIINTCDKITEHKDWLENFVVQTTVKQVLTDENIELIATKAIEIMNKEFASTAMLEYYEKELNNTNKQIKNIVDMIANGMANMSIGEKLTELENYQKDIIENLEYERMKKPTLTKEQVVFWLESFRHGDINDVEYKRKIITALVQSVYVYDTDGGGRKILLNFNTSNNNQIEVEGSHTDYSLHQRASIRTPLYILNYSVFSYLVEIESMN